MTASDDNDDGLLQNYEYTTFIAELSESNFDGKATSICLLHSFSGSDGGALKSDGASYAGLFSGVFYGYNGECEMFVRADEVKLLFIPSSGKNAVSLTF